jgi:hypothetical protein
VAWNGVVLALRDLRVSEFPKPGGRVQVSNHGGAQARWRADGKELPTQGVAPAKQRRLAHPPQPSEPVEKPRKNSMVFEVCRDSGRE